MFTMIIIHLALKCSDVNMIGNTKWHFCADELIKPYSPTLTGLWELIFSFQHKTWFKINKQT